MSHSLYICVLVRIFSHELVAGVIHSLLRFKENIWKKPEKSKLNPSHSALNSRASHIVVTSWPTHTAMFLSQSIKPKDHHGLLSSGSAPREAVQEEAPHPFWPLQDHETLQPCQGNDGVDGEAVPCKQKEFDGYVVMSYVYVFAFVQHCHGIGVADCLIAIQLSLSHQLEPLQFHVTEFQGLGNIGEDGEAVPVVHNEPINEPEPLKYVVAELQHCPLTALGAECVAQHVAFVPQLLHWQDQVTEFQEVGKEGEDGAAVPVVHSEPEKELEPFGYVVAEEPQEPFTGREFWVFIAYVIQEKTGSVKEKYQFIKFIFLIVALQSHQTYKLVQLLEIVKYWPNAHQIV